jgi:hypothetical protein
MTLVHAETYEVAFRWANLVGLDEWTYVHGPEDLTRHRDFRFAALMPLTKGMEHALMYVRASGGRIEEVLV